MSPILLDSTKANDSIYTSYEVAVKNSKYSVLVVAGKLNYVSVKKETANPYGTMGKEFKNFDEAISHYKNAELKLQLLKIELGF